MHHRCVIAPLFSQKYLHVSRLMHFVNKNIALLYATAHLMNAFSASRGHRNCSGTLTIPLQDLPHRIHEGRAARRRPKAVPGPVRIRRGPLRIQISGTWASYHIAVWQPTPIMIPLIRPGKQFGSVPETSRTVSSLRRGTSIRHWYTST
jgi:hypothetical protein